MLYFICDYSGEYIARRSDVSCTSSAGHTAAVLGIRGLTVAAMLSNLSTVADNRD
jgi:hypothetical protein